MTNVDVASLTIQNNEAKKRFEVEVNGRLALLEYILAGKNISYIHTEVPRALEGKR